MASGAVQEMSAGTLAACLEGSLGVLVIDARPFIAFNSSHVTSAHNVHCPPILKRRSGGTIPLENVIRCPKARGSLLDGRYTSVVVYDESSASVRDIPRDSNASLVVKCLTEHARASSLYFLQGGYRRFLAKHPNLLSSQTSLCGNTEDVIMAAATSSSSSSSAASMRCPSSEQEQFDLPDQDQVVPTMADNDDDVICQSMSGMDQGDPVMVLPWLYLGNAFHAAQVVRLRELGITALLNVAASTPFLRSPAHSSAAPPAFHYKHLSIDDTSTSNISMWFPEAFAFIEETRRNQGVVLVHCHAGISRSATICIAYLMRHQCLTLDQAHDFLHTRRSRIAPNLNFMWQLLEYEAQLRDQDHFTQRHLLRVKSMSSSDPGSGLRSVGLPRTQTLPPTLPLAQHFSFDTALVHSASSPHINFSVLSSPS